MAKKIGDLIREARTNAGLTQEELARKVEGVSASEISRAERGEKELTQAELKQIAKATGVTQKSLLEAASGKAKTASSSTAKKSASSTKKSASASSVKVTSAEKKFLELYRAASSDARKAAEAILKGKDEDGSGDLLGALLGGAMDLLANRGK